MHVFACTICMFTFVYIRMFVCMHHVCMYICMHIYIKMFAFTYVCLHVHILTCAYIIAVYMYQCLLECTVCMLTLLYVCKYAS